MSTTSIPDPDRSAHEVWLPSETEQQAERAVLGAMMFDHTRVVIDDVTRVIGPQHLFRPAHQEIMAAILALDAANTPTGPVAVATELERQGVLERVGGAPYLHTLFAEAVVPVSAAFFAEKVRAAALRRFTAEYATGLLQMLRPSMPAEDLLAGVDRASAAFQKLLEGGAQERNLNAGDPEEVDQRLQEWGTVPEGAMSTGITDLDDALNVGRGSLVVVGARAGAGKTTLGGRIARHYAFKRPEAGATIYFSMEMPKQQIQDRDLAALAGIRADTSTGKTPMTSWDWGKLEKAREQYEQVRAYYIDDQPNMDLAHIRATLRSVARKHPEGIGLAVVDYLTLMNMPKRDREDQSIGEVTRQLKLLAQEYNTIIVLIAQLNRNPEARPDGKPLLSDLKGSGGVEQDADAVLLVHDAAKRDETRLGEVDVILAKQRAGVTGAVIAVADRRAYADFGNLSCKAA